ncbi:sulfite exporter TauE/SafE family protein [Actinoplanes oblitus]|uniref:Probable membrane transporter protein n=1 Tax=Actinoplanes oblitus TaxID=3040509 RepID=A0ABY8W415_9ACTN|nr:sulfite exporter TauE/SafE family protein [Actinoplanes oblitus]WIM92576.1 sulfite exporter TauE/SafE family protein [Actinoplanes oblitus]
MLAVALILGVAACAQVVTGFGYSLLSVPLLGLVVGPVDAVVGSTILVLFVNLVMAVRDRSHVRWAVARTVLVAGLPGLPIGLWLLHVLTARTLSVLIAVVVLAGTVAIGAGLRIRPRSLTLAAAGLLSGVLTTSAGVNGPPMAAVFSAMGLPPRPFRATLAAVFAVAGLGAVAGFAVTGQITSTAWLVTMVGGPAVVAGWLAGDRIFTRLTNFRTVVLCALVLASLTTLGRAVAG